MGNISMTSIHAMSSSKLNFEDMQTICKSSNTYFIINTLPISEQDCLIVGTANAANEEDMINRFIRTNKKIRVVIYGRNCNDELVLKKYNQLFQHGFTNVFIYMGGLFEWLMMQDIYGFDEFPTTKKQLDFLKYKSTTLLNNDIVRYT